MEETVLNNYAAELDIIGRKAKAAAETLAVTCDDIKRKALECMASRLEAMVPELLNANMRDTDRAKENGISSAMLDRLTLDEKRIGQMAEGLRIVAAQDDPVGKIISRTTRPNGLEIIKKSVPFGVIGIIYESRPNVTSDAAGICIKAGNTVILRGGSEAFNSNKAIAAALNRGAMDAGLPDGVVQLLPWSDREAVKQMLKLDRYIDLVIPRGGEGLIRMVTAEATMPVLKHYKGVCHLYVDEDCDIEKAVRIIENAKCQRPGVCNALETLLVNRNIAGKFAPAFADVMKRNGVELRCDKEMAELIPGCVAAQDSDWDAEYLSLILAVKMVGNVEEAVNHINSYGSHHSDGILSNIESNIDYFYGHTDSSTVYANASTRFTDGGEFGMGAEIGISTDKLHARGPMGADELTTYKYLVRGTGQIR
ncbi:MAG: glutamate-5-semialdehyde dehydrogenase [Lentisphaeria bacterium]|nr:glutamate-5-semialdehyde dehydrogenase [Lentisphaeria bacterium]